MYIKAEQIEDYFISNDNDADREEFVKTIFNDSYIQNFIENRDNEYYGYKAFERGLSIWEGNYLTRTAERFLSWAEVAYQYSYMQQNGMLMKANNEEVTEQDERINELLGKVSASLSEHYSRIYESNDNVDGYRKAVEIGDDYIKRHPETMGRIASIRGDLISSDREVAAFAFALADNGVIGQFIGQETEQTQAQTQAVATTADIVIGAQFKRKYDGATVEVVSLEGALPFYTDDVTIKHISGGFEVTENIAIQKLLNTEQYEYIAPEQVTPKISSFRITDDNLGVSGTRERLENNMNALLSYLYTMLTLNCVSALEAFGLDSYMSYLHELHPGRESLAMDLIEEFRAPLVDRFVLNLINRNQIKAEDFERTPDGVALKKDSRKKLIYMR